MGANQSRPSDAAVNEKLLERLQALHMKDGRIMNEKDGFVVVGGEARMSLSCEYPGS
jgi:bleomycin hydrolase